MNQQPAVCPTPQAHICRTCAKYQPIHSHFCSAPCRLAAAPAFAAFTRADARFIAAILLKHTPGNRALNAYVNALAASTYVN